MFFLSTWSGWMFQPMFNKDISSAWKWLTNFLFTFSCYSHSIWGFFCVYLFCHNVKRIVFGLFCKLAFNILDMRTIHPNRPFLTAITHLQNNRHTLNRNHCRKCVCWKGAHRNESTPSLPIARPLLHPGISDAHFPLHRTTMKTSASSVLALP